MKPYETISYGKNSENEKQIIYFVLRLLIRIFATKIGLHEKNLSDTVRPSHYAQDARTGGDRLGGGGAQRGATYISAE